MEGSGSRLNDLGRHKGVAFAGDFLGKLEDARQVCYRVYATQGGERLIQDARINLDPESGEPEGSEGMLRTLAVKRATERIEDPESKFGQHYVLTLDPSGNECFDASIGEIESWR